ncbi:hypothetical protein BGLA2_700124 [Burkholderia gladioli]|nr:hypothetical protein BGLA2_700124 [Burkholderia gladioli]
MPDTPVLVSIDGVSKRFGERQVLHDVSLWTRRSEVVSIIGLSDSARPPWLAPSTRCRISTRGVVCARKTQNIVRGWSYGT